MPKIYIDQELCVGCGCCAKTCREGVIGLIDGKAKVLHPEHCDNLARCLPVCPVKAISFQEDFAQQLPSFAKPQGNWPLQLKLTPTQSAAFTDADLLIAADCTAFAYKNFHQDFAQHKALLVGCPKLDDLDYTQIFQEIIENNQLKSLHLVRMEVPCCSFLQSSLQKALQNSGKELTLATHIIALDGCLKN